MTSRPLKILNTKTAPPPPPLGSDPTRGLAWATEPEGLAPAGLTEWRRLGGVYGVDASRFTEGDRPALWAFCSIWADFLAAEKLLNEDGLTIEGRSSADNGRQVKHPALQAKREASQQLRYWAVQLKLTPAARSIGEPGAGDANNPFAG